MWPFGKPENPRVSDTLQNSFWSWVCRKRGHIRVGRYYGLPQATCIRCGKRLPGAGDFVPNWKIPETEFLSWKDHHLHPDNR
jgi:hypothetical protein